MRYRIVLAAVLISLGACTHIARGASFQDLGNLPFTIRDVSDDGRVAVGNGFVAGNKAFKWEAGVVTELPGISPEMGETSAHGVSADGSVIVGRSRNADGRARAYRCEDSVTSELAVLPGAERAIYAATGVSPDGSVVVGEGDGKLLKWDAGGVSVIMDTPGRGRRCFVSDDGSIVVGAYKSGVSTSQAFRSMSGVVIDIAGSAANNAVYDMTPDGSVVIGIDNQTGYRWDEGVLTDMASLIPPDAFPDGVRYAYPRALSADGSMVAGTVGSSGGRYAALWDDNAFYDLNDLLPREYGIDLTGWTLTSAEGISADGTVLFGHGIGPDGSNTWMLTVPEPVTITLLFGLAAAGLFVRRRHE